ncbi:SgcJ/EcaC family oxidoreductase [Actinacidiphila rubida]|uniref:SnoaL-like domain-containing protein n=1 Tax=Actinacidiphila rubida TaxID=310780 RepID=A0A1H8JDP5_9ACTN|nr:SgcJ/EcaC family oxidoreductase [Actinacidiphila rubida]SEN78288.1 conserved hypothetical protein [Actinacidiphila rubida]
MSHPLHAALSGWISAFNRHDPEAMAELFTSDALFQGYGPEPTRGRDAVRAYYAAVAADRSAEGKVLHTFALGEDVAGGFAEVTIRNPEGPQAHVHMSLVLVRQGPAWRIRQYHVSPVRSGA